MNTRKLALLVSMLGSFAIGNGACHSKPAEGPAEQAGKKVDNAAEDAKDAAKETKEDIKKKTD